MLISHYQERILFYLAFYIANVNNNDASEV